MPEYLIQSDDGDDLVLTNEPAHTGWRLLTAPIGAELAPDDPRGGVVVGWWLAPGRSPEERLAAEAWLRLEEHRIAEELDMERSVRAHRLRAIGQLARTLARAEAAGETVDAAYSAALLRAVAKDAVTRDDPDTLTAMRAIVGRERADRLGLPSEEG